MNIIEPIYGASVGDLWSDSKVKARLCALQRKVTTLLKGQGKNPHGLANDCVCRDPDRGGLHYAIDEGFRNSGAAIVYIEELLDAVGKAKP